MDDGVNHTDGVCDNCGARGKLGWVVGYRDRSHRHSCKKTECRDALEAQDMTVAPQTSDPLTQPWSNGWMSATTE